MCLAIEVRQLSPLNDSSFAVIDLEQINNMKRDGTLSAAMDELKAKLAFHRKKASEIETALQALESVTSDNSADSQAAVMNDKEFANVGIAEAAALLIKRLNRPLHVNEITELLQAGGYVFKTEKPLSSVAPVLYMGASKHKYGLINKGKNTYSINAVEAQQQ
jgi:hypothetical protein